MGIEKIVAKDRGKQKEKYLFLLDYLLVKLKTGRPSGISFRNILRDYKSEMGTSLDRDEQMEFLQLYEGEWFTKEEVDRLKIKKKSIETIHEHGSIRNYLNRKQIQSSSDEPTSNHHKPNNKLDKSSRRHITIVVLMILTILVALFIAYKQGVFNIGV